MSRLTQFRPPSVVDEDAALARALQLGDSEAVIRLVDRHGGPVTAAAAGEVGCESIEPIVVGAFGRALDDVDSVEPGADLAPWLAGHLLDQLVEAGAATDGAQIEVRWVVRRELDDLGSDDRRLVRLLRLEGVTVDEVAGRAGQENGEVAAAASRLDRRLATRLDHLGDVDVTATLAEDATWCPAPDALAKRLLADRRPRATVAADGASPDPEPPVSARPTTARQLRAGLIGGILVVLLLFGGIVAFSAAGEPPAVAEFEEDLVPTGLIPDVEGSVEVTVLDGGLRIDVDAPSLPARTRGSFYEGWLRLNDGRLVPIGTFQLGVDVSLFGGIPLADVEELVIGMGVATEDGAERSESFDDVVFKLDFPAE